MNPKMTGSVRARLKSIYRYPVKGLSAEAMTKAELTPGQTLAHDRVYAIENGPGRFRAEAPAHLPKINFLMLMRNAGMAGLQTTFDGDSHTLTIRRDGRSVAQGALNSAAGRAIICQFLAAYLQDDLRGAPHIVHADGHSFSDVADKCLHVVSLASLRALQQVAGVDLNVLRFRPNLVVDGLEPWQEQSWPGKTLLIGGAELKVFKQTERCAAINVNPETGVRDLDLLADLRRTWQHTDFGIYARVTKAGEIAVDDGVHVTADQKRA